MHDFLPSTYMEENKSLSLQQPFPSLKNVTASFASLPPSPLFYAEKPQFVHFSSQVLLSKLLNGMVVLGMQPWSCRG